MNPQHLVAVWNPAYATNPLEAHLRMLLDWDARETTGGCTPDDVYVWWGKVRSSNRQQPMPHLADIIALGASAARDEDKETQLYLTDFRSLYVAHVLTISADDPRVADAAHVPEYYNKQSLNCDCWFLLRDIRVLVRDDLESTTAELAKLRNTRYNDRPVSIYGGMVDVPLLVARPDGRRFFDERECDLLTDGALWAQYDAEQGGVGALEATLRDDHFGALAWSALDSSARRFIAMAERTLREHRGDPAADLSPVLVGYGKAIEAQVNELLRAVMQKAPDSARRVKINDATRMLPDALPLTLGQIAYVLGGERDLAAYLQRTLDDGAWFTGPFPVVAYEFADVRNPAAHGQWVERDVVVRWRNQMLGVGSESVIGRLAGVGPKMR